MKKFVLSLALLAGTAFAQTTPSTPAAQATTQTAIDSALSQTGTLTIRQSLETQKIATDIGTLTLEALTVSIPDKPGGTIKGIAVKVRGYGQYAVERTAFIEPDEIGGVINAVKYIQTHLSDITTTSGTQISYTSKSGVRISIFYSSYDNSASIAITASNETAYIKPITIQALYDTLTAFNLKLK